MDSLLSLSWSFLAGFPTWFAVVLWPVMKLVGMVAGACILSLVLLGMLAEASEKQAARVKARAEADNEEALKCSR